LRTTKEKTTREINADETDALFRFDTLSLQASVDLQVFAGLQVSPSFQLWASSTFPGSHIGRDLADDRHSDIEF
jgi:hypothetical protein